MIENNAMLEAALSYAGRGWKVFPIAAGAKVPRKDSHGCLDATTDEAQIREWWAGKPFLNVGIATGSGSGIWVLDVDGQPGAESIAAWEDSGRILPETMLQRSQSGGRQLVFLHPGRPVRTDAGRLAPGIDVRGEGGYFVAPPSRTSGGGEYRWLDERDPVEAPAWLLELVTGGSRPSASAGPVDLETLIVEAVRFRDHPGAAEGRRNHEAARLIGCEFAAGATAAELLADATAWARRCRPPMDLDELATIVASIAARERSKAEPIAVGDDDDDYEPAILDFGGIPDEGWKPFPVEHLPGIVSEWVCATAEAMSADPAMLATAILPTLAGVIGNALAVELGQTWREPSILWGATVAESGTAKTPCHERVIEFVDVIDAELERENVEDRKRHAVESRQFEAALAAWRAAARRKEGTDEDPPTEPKPAIVRAVSISDVTPEALAVALTDNPKGLLLERDELSAWLAGFDRYRSSGGAVSAEAAGWLSLYNARPLRVDRRSSERIRIPRASVSIVGGIQPEILAKSVRGEHLANGLLPRFLLAAPPRRRRVFSEKSVPAGVSARLLAAILALRDLPALPDGPRIVGLDDKARQAWRKFFDEHSDRQFATSGVVASVLAKAEAAAGRLALVIHATRVAAGEQIDREAVDHDSMRKGIALSRWYVDEWLRIHGGSIAGPAMTDDERAVLRAVRKAGGDIADRDLRGASRRLKNSEARGRAVASLVQSGRLETYVRQKDGRPAVWIRTPAPPVEGQGTTPAPIDEVEPGNREHGNAVRPDATPAATIRRVF